MATRGQIEVENHSDQYVERGGLIFPPKTTDTYNKPHGFRLMEVKACKFLTVVSETQQEGTAAVDATVEDQDPPLDPNKGDKDQDPRSDAGAVQVNATEGAIKLAKAHHLDIANVKGSGSEGRVTQGDVEAHLGKRGSED